MNGKLKIALWVGGIVVVGVGTPLLIVGVKRYKARKRLDEAFDNPSSIDSVGGIDKLAVSGFFDRRLHQDSGKATISKVEARERAKVIWDNYGDYFWSSHDTGAMMGAFDGLGHVHDVSKISDEFYQSYDEELQTVIDIAFSGSEHEHIIIDKIMRLPNN